MSNTSNVNILSLTEVYGSDGQPGWRGMEGVQFAVPGDFNPTGTAGSYDFTGYTNYLNQIKATLPDINTLRLFVNEYTFDDATKAAYWKGFVEAAANSGFKLILTYADGQISSGATNPTASWSHIGDIATGWHDVLTWVNSNATVSNAVYGYELLNEPEAYSQDASGAAMYVDHLRVIYGGSDAVGSTGLWGNKKILVGGLGASSQFGELAQTLDFSDNTSGTGLDKIKDIVGTSNLVWSYHTYSQWALSDNPEDYISFFQNRLAPVLGDNILFTEFATEHEHLLDYNASTTEPQHFAFMEALNWMNAQGIGMAYWSPTTRPTGAELFSPLDSTISMVHHDATARLIDLWAYGDTNGVGTGDQILSATTANNGIVFGHDGNDTLTGRDSDTNHALDLFDLTQMRTEQPPENLSPGETDFVTQFNAVMGTTLTKRTQITQTQLDTFNATVGEISNIAQYGGKFATYGVLGNESRDILIGGTGDDSVKGLRGDDYGFGDAGNDTLDGGLGRDQLFGGDGNDSILGGGDDDFLMAGLGDDLVYGGAGNDTILGGAGTINQKLTGNAGHDVFAFAKGDGGRIMDFILGDDIIDVSKWGVSAYAELTIENRLTGQNALTGEVYVRLVDSVSQAVLQEIRVNLGNVALTKDDLTASSFFFFPAQSITGDHDLTNLNDVLTGGNGADTITGGAGNDTLNGANGFDFLYGGVANDSILGGDGNDSLYGGDGNDTLAGGNGNDRLDGGAGIDTAIFSGAAAVTVNLGLTTVQTTGQGSDILVNVENVTSGDGNDVLTGNTLANILSGGNGNDSLLGGGGNDKLYGGEGNDTLNSGLGNDSADGGNGNDTIIYAGGVDTLAGGGGNDTLVLSITSAATVQLSNNTNNLGLTISGFENITGGTGANSFIGSYVANTLIGNDGGDSLSGWGGDDKLYGGNGNDYHWGADGNDSIYGGAGNDMLEGDNGNDLLSGGLGNDTFKFNTVASAGDTITDFGATASTNDDRFYLQASGIGGGLAAGTLATSQFVLRSSGHAAVDADDRFVYDAAAKSLWFDVDGTGAIVAVQLATLQSTAANLTYLDIVLF